MRSPSRTRRGTGRTAPSPQGDKHGHLEEGSGLTPPTGNKCSLGSEGQPCPASVWGGGLARTAKGEEVRLCQVPEDTKAGLINHYHVLAAKPEAAEFVIKIKASESSDSLADSHFINRGRCTEVTKSPFERDFFKWLLGTGESLKGHREWAALGPRCPAGPAGGPVAERAAHWVPGGPSRADPNLDCRHLEMNIRSLFSARTYWSSGGWKHFLMFWEA